MGSSPGSVLCSMLCVCRKRMSSPHCRSEFIGSVSLVIVPGQKKNYLISTGIINQILGPRKDKVSVPLWTVRTLCVTKVLFEPYILFSQGKYIHS